MLSGYTSAILLHSHRTEGIFRHYFGTLHSKGLIVGDIVKVQLCLWAADCCCVDGATFCAVSSSKAAAAVWCPLRSACTAHCSLIRLELCISASSVYTLQCLLYIQCSSLAPVMLMPLPGQGGDWGCWGGPATMHFKLQNISRIYLLSVRHVQNEKGLFPSGLQLNAIWKFDAIFSDII